ncbi:MAG: hypothetical protein KF764_08740 [Labilithrix sp.]|nr:hypothetical protein [Labilithrix sp.]
MGDLREGICPTCEEAPRTFRGVLRVATLAIVIEDNNRLRTALRRAVELLRRHGDGTGDGREASALAAVLDRKEATDG